MQEFTILIMVSEGVSCSGLLTEEDQLMQMKV